MSVRDFCKKMSSVESKHQKIEINLLFSPKKQQNTSHAPNDKNVNLKIDVFKITQIPGGLFIGRKSFQFYLICGHKF